MLKFTIIPESIQSLEEGSGWIAGYFEIGNIDCKLSLFRDRNCLLMPTLSLLLDYLWQIDRNEGKRIGWLGIDNGTTITLRKFKGIFTIEATNFNASFRFEEVSSAIINESTQFITDCQLANTEVVNESAFIDLINILTKINNNSAT